MNIWFTSDSHFGHRNIAGPSISKWKSGYRNFNSLEEMNQTIIQNINEYVKEKDILYHLGDWSFGNIYNVYRFRKSLICDNIYLVRGNHDAKTIRDRKIIIEGGSFNPMDLFLSVENILLVNIGEDKLFLSHYSHRVWPSSHRGSIHLFGHSHGNLPGIGKSMDVGLDTHPDFRPYHIDEIRQLLKGR